MQPGEIRLSCIQKGPPMARMKPIVPEVGLPLWKQLYSSAQAVQDARPWDVLDDSGLIGVRNPDTNDTGFGCFMGSGGTMFGFVLFRGAEGFRNYRDLMEHQQDPRMDDSWATQNAVRLAFGAKSDLYPEDLEVIRKLGLRFKGKTAWPEFRSHLPGFFPWFLTDSEARFLNLGIRAALFHHGKVLGGSIAHSLRGGKCLVYIPQDANERFKAEWEPCPEIQPDPPKPLPMNLGRIRSLLTGKPKPDSPWEADVFVAPAPVNDRARPYFIHVALACQSVSGHIFHFLVEGPGRATHELVAEVICSSIEKSGYMPRTIFVRDDSVAHSLAPLAAALGLSIEGRGELNAIGEAKEALTQAILSGAL